jgi:cell division initiation protein
MDRIKPIDRERIQFKHSFMGGYDKADVHAFLEKVGDDMEALLQELAKAREDCNQQRIEIEGYRAQESTLKEALMLAQKTADETRANAHRQAELIVQETLQRTDQLAQDLQVKVSDLRWEVERLRLEKQKFLKGFRGMLEEHLRDLERAELSESVREQLELEPDGEPSAQVV